MTDAAGQDALQRKRLRNRKAQQRFRQKKKLQKSLGGHEYRYGACVALEVTSTNQLLGSACPSSTASPAPSVKSGTAGYFDDYDASSSLESPYGLYFTMDDANMLDQNQCDIFSLNPSFPSANRMPTSSQVIENTLSSPQTSAPASEAGGIMNDGPLHELDLNFPADIASKVSGGGWMGPLHLSAGKGRDRIVRMLLQHNADCNEPDSEGMTPIMHAVVGGHEDVVRVLLSHGACVGSTHGSSCNSALHLAVLHRRENLIKVLVDGCSEEDRKSIIDGVDDLGRTPLHVAIDIDFEAAVLMLLHLGANVRCKARSV